jgi:cell division protein FtsA
MARNNLLSVLDIGSEKISVFVGVKGVNNIFIVKAKAEVNYGGFQEGEWLDYKNLGTAINKALKLAEKQADIKIKKLYLGVPGEFVTAVTKELSPISFNKPRVISSGDLDVFYSQGSIYEQTGEYVAINSAPIFYTLDNKTRLVDPCGATAKDIKGLVSFILADKKFYVLMSKLMEKLGLKEVEFIASNWAEGMYLFDDETRDGTVLIADIGYITTSVTLLRGDGVLFHRAFSLGGGHIEADIMRVLNVSYDQAMAIKKRINLSLQPEENEYYDISVEGRSEKASVSYVQNIASARIMDIGETIAECLKKCEYDCPAYLPLYITGGGISYIGGAKEIISEATGRSIELIAPNVPEHSKPQYSSVFGVMHIAERLEERAGGLKNIFQKLFRG